jgi:diacylglycerol kinase (ATP)
VDGEQVYDGSFIFYAVGNGWRTGGGTRITPQADAADGWLDLVVVQGSRRRDLLAVLPELRAGRHLEHPDVVNFRGRRVEVSAEARISVNADGEAVAGRRFRYDLLPGAIRLMLE